MRCSGPIGGWRGRGRERIERDGAIDPTVDFHSSLGHSQSRHEGREMSTAIARRLLGLTLATTCIYGCSEGKHPFRMVQFCLADTQEIPAFTSFMNEIAQEYRMEFTDRSGQTADELRSLASDNKNVPVNDRAVNIGADRGSDFSFGAGNLGLPARQIAIGFNGSNLETAKPFADDVVKRLATRWRIHEVPQGRGALPLSHCD